MRTSFIGFLGLMAPTWLGCGSSLAAGPYDPPKNDRPGASGSAGSGGSSGSGSSPLAPMPTARAYAAATIGADGQIYVIAGDKTSGSGWQKLAVVEAFDPQQNAWTARPSLIQPRTQLAAARGASGRIYAWGDEVYAQNEVFDPTA